jgi:hypothetical protein
LYVCELGFSSKKGFRPERKGDQNCSGRQVDISAHAGQGEDRGTVRGVVRVIIRLGLGVDCQLPISAVQAEIALTTEKQWE